MNQSSKSELTVFLGDLVYDQIDFETAKAKLLDLALSCLPEKFEIPLIDSQEMLVGTGQARGFNSAIDTIEAQIRRAFS